MSKPEITSDHNSSASAVRLFTWQTPDFSITEGKVDREKSYYYRTNTPSGIQQAYKKMAQILGTDQIIWCYYDNDDEHLRSSVRQTRWILSVPSNQVMSIIDCFAWEFIINQGGRLPSPPTKVFQAIRLRAACGCNGNDKLRQELIELGIREYYSRFKPDTVWEDLFLNELPSDEESYSKVACLLQHPVNPEWVIDRQTL